MSLNRRQIFSLVKTAIFVVLVPGFVAFYVPLRWIDPHKDWNSLPHELWQFIGFLPFVAGVAMSLWCAWDFAVTGQGTPIPIDAPRVLVVKGLYAYVRNPMYVGVLNIILGFAIWFASAALVVYLGCLWLGFHLFVTLYEEPHLRRVFGEPYRIYCQRVNRWWPRVPAQ